MRLTDYIVQRQADAEKSQIAEILAGGEVTLNRAYALRNAIETAADSFDDETAQEYPELYPQWQSGVAYTSGQRVQKDGILYTVLQDHTSQADWTPTDAPSLFAKVLTNVDGTPTEWEQPDSTNPYMTGDKVIYNGVVYESVIDNNVWSPEAYPQGWKAVEG